MATQTALSEQDARQKSSRLGVPYWKDRDCYPKGKVSDEEWRWEFLRRDWRYREDWKRFCLGEMFEIWPEHIIEYGLVELLDPTKSYRQLQRKVIFQQYPVILSASGGSEWGYYNIDEKQSDTIDRFLEMDLDEDHFISVKFNMARPISPQIERLRGPLDMKQKKHLGKILRQRISDSPNLYLRTIDALLVQVDLTTIGEEIFGCLTKPSAATRGKQAKDKIKNLWHYF